nr:reverse transcriptase domain-containing protein [Tanacetum cinerariifolium]
MAAILKQFQATPPPASIKAIEEIFVTCGVAHPYYQCLAIGGNTFLELKDNIQGYVAAAAINYNQGNSVYRPPEAIVVPPILAEQFELKHSLINMMTSDQFFGLEKDIPHDHIRWGGPSVARKRTLAFYSYLGGSCLKIHQ